MPKKIKLEKMQIISVHLPPKMIEMMDAIVAAGLYSNRSELIRAALSEFIQKVMSRISAENEKNKKQETSEEEDIEILKA